MVDTLHFTEETLSLARQLLNFHNAGHQYAKEVITQDSFLAFHFINTHCYEDPQREGSVQSDSSTSRRGRSQGYQPAAFPLEWTQRGGKSEIKKV